MFGIGGRAFSSTDGIKGMFATVSTSLMSWKASLRRHQGVVGFLDFTWHLAQDLAEVGAGVEKANDRPQILHVLDNVRPQPRLDFDFNTDLASSALLVALPC
jgi:hypothetical protein